MSIVMDVRELSVTTRSPTPDILVHPISFSLKAGQPLTLLGETGSGKSLLAQALMGNLPRELQASGQVFVDGVDLLQLPPRQRQRWWGRRMAMLPQEPWHALDPTMAIDQQISEGYRLVAGLSAQQAEETALVDLEQLDLKQVEGYLPSELSGGMAQRAAFAAARTGAATIVIADEPTKGLDNARRDDVVRLLAQAAREQGVLLTITHDIAVARQLSQLGGDIMIVKSGKCMEHGPAHDILDNPASDYGQRLLAADPQSWPAVQHTPRRLPSPIIEAQSVTKTRGGKQLFQDLSLSLSPGEVVGITGPSGCGKSTLGDMLLGLVKPDRGKICRSNDYSPRRFQKLYQDPPAAFSPYWTMGTLLADLCRLHRIEHRRIPALLKRLELHPDLLGRRPDAISGGELQRFAILRALLLDPVFLFADEPTSRLDPITQQETIALLVELARERHCSLLLVSHDEALIQHSCDRQISLHH